MTRIKRQTANELNLTVMRGKIKADDSFQYLLACGEEIGLIHVLNFFVLFAVKNC